MGWSPEENPDDRMYGPHRGIRARGQRHRDAPISRRERIIWRIVWAVFGAIGVGLFVFALTR